MSQAFVREQDEEWLQDVKPDPAALLRFLKRENGGRPVQELRVEEDKSGRKQYVMSNGLTYMLDVDNRWQVVL